MEFFIRSEIIKNEENNTVKSLLKNLLEMLELAFQESIMNIDGLVEQQIRNLERYERFIGSTKLLEEVSIHDARKIVHIGHPKYKLNDIVNKASKLRDSLKGNGMDSLGIIRFNNPNHLTDSNKNAKNFSINQITENKNEENLTLDLLLFEETQSYEERYLISNEIHDYYCYGNHEYNLFFNNFYKDYELGILEEFNTHNFDIDLNIDSNSNSIYKIESNPSSNSNSGLEIEEIPIPHQSFGSSSSLESSPYSQYKPKSQTNYNLDSNSNSEENISHSWSTVLTPQNTKISEESSDRFVNRSISKLKPDQKEIISIDKGKESPDVLKAIGYCHTSSFYTVKSLE
ncbi:hypothetical protein [Cryptosporidium parvum Iowa II]|uniref:Uncharacterized protein n=2 Tax=Cryptosporidium parvum TaxID=5807 RepID=A0A7G2HK33_CRYPV|nr:hypothetical protein [Cryptosporidium parvum Iowa II]QOY41296.1 Uncharacterized protein CPATCC_0015700 [Cryptosporidium parvum]WKS78524.1 hypothetical protein CPCDC_6g4090 [Cryptosporidium sp. 43IA8]EAK90012.1 putative low complexity protein [Cryptosporidium parvum Iowa II]WRK33016.1 Uncharacterized protein cpbgf_6004090 [Cryptosporidium parvum]CAD98450.1 hypothetical predicted protein, unknown function [Cryptosporidium parvum]|eukprot:QOY41296.1 hypothetical protein CPATCC_002979 [Cryptosporidium parvum]